MEITCINLHRFISLVLFHRGQSILLSMLPFSTMLFFFLKKNEPAGELPAILKKRVPDGQNKQS